MEDTKTFAARFASKCRGCQGNIEIGAEICSMYDERQLASGEFVSTGKRRYFHADCRPAHPARIHSHEGHWANHPIETRHRKQYAPELHTWMPKTQNGDAPIGATVDLSEVEGRLDVLESREESTREVEVVKPGKANVNVGRQHMMFAKLVRYAGAGVNVAMKGPAGSGKTMAAEALAEALELPFYAVPLGPQTSKSDLVGYKNGAGDYVRTMLREAYENGGVCLIDEMDAANPAVLTIINSALANGSAGFVDGMVKRHEDCIFVCAMNTFGRGADNLYVGRAQLDAATLDRWVTIEWDYDWAFTREIVQNDEWVSYVEGLSNAAAAAKVRVVIGPRAAIHGARLLAAGTPRDEVEQDCIWAPISENDKTQILARR